jgi:uncharacterized DUF497 family protein
MMYEWDEVKRKSNIEKHGLDFVLAPLIMDSTDMFVLPDDRFDYGEDRYLAYAEINGMRLCVCYVKKTKDTIRIISLRRAHKKEWRKLK